MFLIKKCEKVNMYKAMALKKCINEIINEFQIEKQETKREKERPY
jgi:hypothetical protein